MHKFEEVSPNVLDANRSLLPRFHSHISTPGFIHWERPFDLDRVIYDGKASWK